MDRDKRWERVALAYAALTDAGGETAATAEAAVAQSYVAEKSDEFVLPTAIDGFAGMRDGDGLLMANFRADRAREKIGRAHACTPVTNAHLVCPLLREKKQ